jgi:hypothetical protein
MGKSLHLLLQNIHKLPIPAPTRNPHNPHILQEQYCEILLNYLFKIKDVNEFILGGQVYLPICNNNNNGSLNDDNESDISSSSRLHQMVIEPEKSKSSLGFILNQPEVEENYSMIIENLPKVRYLMNGFFF